MDIHAFAAKTPKATLQPFTYQEPALSPYEVLIEITHCGLCYSDIHLIDDDWKRSLYPLIPGHEVIGKIVKKGSLVQKPLNQRVGVSWLYSSCLECPTCLQGDTQVCPTRKATCIGHHGGFASHMTADSRFIYPIPEKLDSADAAPLLCAGATVFAPLRRYKIQGPDKVAVVGVGGLGHLAIQFANALGCHVTAISSTPGKEKEVKQFGAKDFVLLDQALKNPKAISFDLILSTIHSDIDWNALCALLKPTGTLCILGRPLKPLSIDLFKGLNAQRSIATSSVASRATLQEMLNFAAEHQIKPQIELMKMDQINEAIQKVRENKARYRVVLER